MDTRIVFATSHDGVRVAASVSGSGFPLLSLAMPLLSHAGLPTMPMAAAFLQRLAATHRLLLLDLRGSGMADWDPPSHTFDDYMYDIIAMLDALHIARTDVWATCGRSPVALRLAARFPERVRHLYLQGIAIGANAAEGRPLLRPTARRLAKDDWRLYQETVAARTLGEEAGVAEVVARMEKSCDRKNLLAALDALYATNIVEDVRALRHPTLVVEPQRNTMMDEGQAERFLALVPHAQLHYVPNRPGWLLDFAAAIEEFEAELDAPRWLAPNAGALSEREAEVLRLLSAGHTNAEISVALVVTKATVRSHVAHIYAKINVRNRAEATRWALTHGLAGS